MFKTKSKLPRTLVHRCKDCGVRRGEFHHGVPHSPGETWYPNWEPAGSCDGQRYLQPDPTRRWYLVPAPHLHTVNPGTGDSDVYLTKAEADAARDREFAARVDTALTPPGPQPRYSTETGWRLDTPPTLGMAPVKREGSAIRYDHLVLPPVKKKPWWRVLWFMVRGDA